MNCKILTDRTLYRYERFRRYPPGDREEYVLTDYSQPTDWRNRRGIGFDRFSEATRREAIISTRNRGNPVLTGPLRLKQETEQNVQVGVLLFFPIYAATAPEIGRASCRERVCQYV